MKVKILICYHKPDVIFKDDILTPIHVGRVNAIKNKNKDLAWMQENKIGDDTGDNISHKNASYNELTALYWAWKNYDKLGNPDYIGLMHYRRHFVFDETKKGVIDVSDIGEDGYLEAINYSRENIEKLLKDCDFMYHQGKVDNIYKHYAENHRVSDLDKAITVLKNLYPEYASTADKYLKQDYGCFCNMVISPKKIFFSYCEWLFKILEEFEKVVDISEKRLFVSERLTGIFVQKLINEGYKGKPLASTFTKFETNIPIAIPYDTTNVFPTAVTIISCLENADKSTAFSFYLLSKGKQTKDDENKFKPLKSMYKNFSLTFINVEKYIENIHSSEPIELYYPLLVAEAVPSVNKCFYVTNRVLAMKDLEEFYRTASVDDYWVLGAPDKKTRKQQNLEYVYSNTFMLNTAKMREHKVWAKAKEEISKGASFLSTLNTACNNQIGFFPEWFYVTSTIEDVFIPKMSKERDILQKEALWHAFINYEGEYPPYEDIQGLYSNFWWKVAYIVPSSVPFLKINENNAIKNLIAQQKRINKSIIKRHKKPTKLDALIEKTRRYYKVHGFKKTVRKIRQRIFKR